MFGPTIACLVVGLAVGTWSAWRYLPPLAATREGAIAAWVVRGFFGCAVAWAAMQIYYAVHAYATLHPHGEFTRFENRSEILTSTFQSIALLDGLLIGAAAVIYLLAPVQRQLRTAEPPGAASRPAQS